MNNKTFYSLLQDAVYDEQVRAYSGRYMYGRRCIGVYVLQQESSPFGFIARCCHTDNENEREDLINIFENTKTDSLGLGTILYWPEMEWQEDFD